MQSLVETAAQLKNRKIGVEETVLACLDQIDKCEPRIDALLAIDREKALNIARKMDSGTPDTSKPLWGVPLILKDALSTKGLKTTAASRILANFIPFYDAFVVKKLKDAGAIILAKANMDEFAMGSSTENSAFKITRNPWNTDRVPGGSSGGSAAAVSSRECFAALGSDTGGSIRQPAAFCGCTGLKPTYGRVSRYGLFAFASSLDQIGPITNNIEDCALMLKVIAGYDAKDNTSANVEVPDYMECLENIPANRPLSGINIGYPEKFFGEGLSEEVREICQNTAALAQKLGANLVKIELTDPDIASATYYITAMAEASSNLARYDGIRYGKRAPDMETLDELYNMSRSMGFGQEVKRRIMLGSFVLSSGYYDAYFKKAAQARRLLHNQYQYALDKCDFILMPVAPVTAWPIGTHLNDPLAAYLMDAFTLPVNLAGLPGLSIPAGIGNTSKMPVGIQLVGKMFAEGELLKYGKILQDALPDIGKPAIIN